MEPPAENVEFLRRGLFCYLRVFGPSVRRGFASPAWGLSNLLPFGHVIPPSGGVWAVCEARLCFPSLELKQLAALRARDSAVRRSWDACAARLCFPSLGLKQLAALLARDSALRRSLDACAARGKAGPVMGLRPLLGPPCIPPEAPPRAFSNSAKRRGHAARAAGASFPRSTRSGDLPPRRVNARVHFRSGWNPFQPTTADRLPEKDMALHRFQGISRISIITNLTDSGRKP